MRKIPKRINTRQRVLVKTNKKNKFVRTLVMKKLDTESKVEVKRGSG